MGPLSSWWVWGACLLLNKPLFIFDPEQQAILLVAGDKTGQWTKWYKQNIPLAEKRYEEYLRKRRDNA
ncbi:type II toxin-antitoxin system RelE/ParE family toxin [Rothia nasimurium]|uniref:type II toxin-antitoxin system RelE/ParE family toxin n=1 Tax=Rothia nasimurium TaxID=85336 RepID=UPI0034DF7797